MAGTRVAILLSVLLLGLAVSAGAAESVSRQTTTFAGRERTAYLYVPDGLAAPAPMIVLLHGSGGGGLFMLQLWRDLAAREHIVLLAPESLDTEIGWDLHDDGPDDIHQTIEAAAASVPTDRRRLYVFGQSGGAVYALTLAMLESEYFAAVAFHAGGWRRPAEYRVMDYARRKIPLAIYVGDRDGYFPLASVRNTERLLSNAGFPAQLTVLDGRRHSILDVAPNFNDTVWDFLKIHALGDAPKFVSYRLGAASRP